MEKKGLVARFLLSRAHCNYLFFGSYFLLIAIIHLLHVVLIEPISSFSRWYFIGYSVAQCALETLLLVIISSLIKQFLHKFIHLLFVCVIFILFLSHVVDFPMIRLMDMSFWYGVHFISQESWANIVELLYASNVSFLVWGMGITLGLLILLGGVFVHYLTEKWVNTQSCLFTYSRLMGWGSSLCVLMFLGEYSVRSLLDPLQVEMYQKTLGWKRTFSPMPAEYIFLHQPLKPPSMEQMIVDNVESHVNQELPDIYLFIIESLREDYITANNTPHLHQFKQHQISFDLALSNANATHLSWFSLFHSQFPLYWGKITPHDCKQGSIPLQLLKKMGYQIHVSASSRLGYYQMEHMLFGQQSSITDSLYQLESSPFKESYQRDQMAMNYVLQEMDNQLNRQGRCFIVFLDASHLDYSWPQDTGNIFSPFEKKINYFEVAVTNHKVDKIRNRYRNALYFIDSLFESFFQKLYSSQAGKDAIVVITGDHGEEFYEQGHLFHASDLSREQTHVPLYYQLSQNRLHALGSWCQMTCHMDIFPTIFHYLTGDESFGRFFQGESIFKKDRWPYVVTARFNASRTPYEFCIHNGSEKMIAQFSDERNIFKATKVKVLSTKNREDESIVLDSAVIEKKFGRAFDRLCGFVP